MTNPTGEARAREIEEMTENALERWWGEKPHPRSYDDNRPYDIAVAAWKKRLPTPSPADPIIKGLSDAQRRLILWNDPTEAGEVMVHGGGVTWQAALALRSKGLTEPVSFHWARLSPLGHAVRRVLLSEKDRA